MTTDPAPAPAGQIRPGAFRWLPPFLFRAERWPAYVVKAWLLALLPSVALAALISFLAPDAAAPAFGAPSGPVQKSVLAVALVFVGPLLETLIMGLALAMLRALFGFAPAVALSALGWGLAHSFGGLALGGPAVPTWGLVVWWPFLILSITYLTWRNRGLAAAIGTATVIHGLQNSLPAAALLLA